MYCIELRDTGNHKFVLPADQINDTISDLYVGTKAVLDLITQDGWTVGAPDDSYNQIESIFSENAMYTFKILIPPSAVILLIGLVAVIV